LLRRSLGRVPRSRDHIDEKSEIMCDYRVNRIWIAACLVLTLGTSAAAVASGHTALPRTVHASVARSAVVAGPADTGWPAGGEE
jgi:hypothetical protein